MRTPSFIPNPLPRLRHLLPRGARLRHHLICTQTTPKRIISDPPPHIPVLVQEIISYFSNRPLPVFVDCTVGAGGHAHALLSALPIKRYIGIDKDHSALSLAKHQLQTFPQTTLIQGDFRNLPHLLHQHGLGENSIDGMLLDVGVSSMQLDRAERGFSLTRDGPLDMRMDNGASGGISASDLVNGLSATELATVFREFGEERMARRIAEEVVRERMVNGPILRTGRLAETVGRVKGWRKRGMHPATLVFQAVRIAVNGELGALEEGLIGGVGCLRKGGGRLAVVCFHSLEDRIAKQCFKRLEGGDGGVGIVTKRPVVAGEMEGRRNVRARSAKLRVVERLGVGERGWRVKVNKYERTHVDEVDR